MKTRTRTRSRFRTSALSMAVSSLPVLLAAPSASGQSRTANVMILRDPTPRPVDLDKVLGKPGSDAEPVSTHRIAGLNGQRLALITRASAQVESLALVLQKALVAHVSGASLAQEVQVAGAIEMLSSNVHGALLAQRSDQSSARNKQPQADIQNPELVDVRQLSMDGARLLSLSEQLQNEVHRSTADTLSVGVLTKSAQVCELAHSLKLRMSRP